jgi:hypothetical protein
MMVLLASCIKDNIEGCERDIVFEYYADGDTDVFPKHVTSVNLYVFDSEDRLLEKYCRRLEQNDLKSYQGVKLSLNPGEYRFVCLGNDYDLTEVYNTDCGDMSGITYRNPDCFETLCEGNDSLYLGSKHIVIPEDAWYFRDKIRLYSSHLKVSYTVKGYYGDEPTRAGGYLGLRVKNLAPQSSFDQAHAQNLGHGEKVDYAPEFDWNSENGDHVARFNIMRHEADNSVEFELVDKATGTVLHTLALKDFLAEYEEYIDVTKQEVLIPIVVEFKTVGITVTIADWVVNNVTPGFGNDNGNEPDDNNNI